MKLVNLNHQNERRHQIEKKIQTLQLQLERGVPAGMVKQIQQEIDNLANELSQILQHK